jgi:outer membrane receptor protein involved in Fe transport
MQLRHSIYLYIRLQKPINSTNINTEMKNVIWLTIIFFYAQCDLFAQIGSKKNGLILSRLYGKVIDNKTSKPLQGALVQVLMSSIDSASRLRKNTIIATQTTARNGDFTFETIPFSKESKLRVSLGSYQTFENVLWSINNTQSNINAIPSDFDLGNIKIAPFENNEVVVTNNQSLFQLRADRKVFNVDKNNMSTGGTAIDVLRNVPSVQIDIDGNVQLRNSAPQVFVDGRPTTLTFDQIPADAIASVELITNPSVKFDASGGNGGIINIVLKKNKKKGYNGNLRTNIDSRAIVGGGVDLNVRRNKLNYFFSSNYNGRKSIAEGESERINLFNTPIKKITQQSNNVATGSFANIRGGIDFLLDNRNTITISGRYVKGLFKPKERSETQNDSTNYATQAIPSKFVRDGHTKNNFRNRGVALAYKRNFTKTGQEFTADVDYNKNDITSNNFLYSTFDNPLLNTAQQVNSYIVNELIVAQTDYVQPLPKQAKIEMGLRYQRRNITNLNINKVNEITIAALGYDYANSESIYAIYANHVNTLAKVGYAFGLRMESSLLAGQLKNTPQTFSTKYPFSLFPSASFNYKINEKQDLQFSYSRRVNRPTFFQILPFIDFTDSLNITSGNPALRPEFTNSIEASYNITRPKGQNILITLYSKISKGLVSRYQYKTQSPLNNQEVLVNGWINANNASTSGIEFVSKNILSKNWEVLSNLNIYIGTLTLIQNGIKENNSRTSYFLKQNHTYKFPKNWALQFAVDYQSKTILPPGNNSSNTGGRGGPPSLQPVTSSTQGYLRLSYGLDIAVKKDIGKAKNIAITLNISDVFKTRINDIYTETEFFTQNYFRRRDWRLIRLNISYKFGKQDINLFKRKNNKPTGEGAE